MIVSIETNTPQYANDLADVVRVFVGGIDMLINQPGGDLTVHHTLYPDGSQCTVTLSGLFTGVRTQDVKPGETELERKRYQKRASKQCLYALMKASTGRTPPWGSLTGIRPTRLLYQGMEQGLSLEEAAASVKENFDVQPEKLSLLKEIVAVQTALPEPQKNEIDLYIGIPFCVSRCVYCSFLSGEVGKGKQLEPYVAALEKEIAGTLRLIHEKGLIPRTFYMGGGTPTSLPAPLLRRVLDAAQPFITRAREVTVEAGRPDTLNEEKLSVILQAGATRISINPQTMHDETLERIGRRHTRLQTEEAYALARKLGFHHVNMDLIAGLPGENLDMFRQTLQWSRDMAPESLTVHTLSIKHSSLLNLWQAALPDGSMVSDMVDAGREEAARRGMQPYYLYRQKYMAGNLENVGYALPGHACLYNIGMMEETAHVLAVGAGAISKRVVPSKGIIRRAPNVSDIEHYIARSEEMLERKEALWAEKLPD